jgi:hypothetical protein
MTQYARKREDETVIVTVNFSNRLLEGELPDSVETSTSSEEITVEEAEIVGNTDNVRLKIAGGLVEKDYTIVCALTTSDNNILEEEVEISIVNG